MASASFDFAGLTFLNCLQEMLAYKADIMRHHDKTVIRVDVQAAEQARADAEVRAPRHYLNVRRYCPLCLVFSS